MRIRNNEYAIPSRVSRSASKLIQKLLSEQPEDRPALDTVLTDEFFTRGFFPQSLPSVCCVAPPKFTAATKNLNANTQKRSATANSNRNSAASCNSNSSNEHASVTTVRDALDRISLKDVHTDGRTRTHSDENAESGIDSQGSHGDDEEVNENSLLEDVIDEDDSTFDYHNPQKLCSRVNACLTSMPDRNSLAEKCADPLSTGHSDSDEDTSGYDSNSGDPAARLWITKWVDYSNKYGFGAQLSNGCIVIRYNDGTTLAVDANKRRLQYFDEDRNIFRFSVNNIPEDLSRKVTLLNYFSNYMDKHLLKGGDIDDSPNAETFTEISIIDIWFRTDKAMVMYLSDGTLQVNFLSDHTKLILNPEQQEDVVTFINEERESFVMTLSAVAKKGCQDAVHERLQYCLMVLHKLADMYLEEDN